MEKQEKFLKSVVGIALPVTLQSLLQSSFSVIDQLMIGKLGSSSIAGVGLGGKFASIYSVLLAAVAAAAGIMISQYIGQREEKEVSRSFFANLFLAVGMALAFTAMCVFFSEQIMRFYTKDVLTKEIAADYLRILSFSYVPMAISSLLSTILRCMEAAVFPLYASMIAVVFNTCLNYLLIFGKAGLPAMSTEGAAYATVISQTALSILILLFFLRHYRRQDIKMTFLFRFQGKSKRQYFGILFPIIACEFFWSLGENVYTAIYGNMGTEAVSAMTLTVPIQTLLIGALSGLSQAAGILIGKSLGCREYEKAYKDSKRLMLYGLCGSLFLSLLLVISGKYYVGFYQVESPIQRVAYQILVAFAIIVPIKIQNMILGGGIIRSGGKTKYIMCIDFIGTWLFGVPLGLLSAFIWKLSIPYVYFILSLEECVRFLITFVLFRKKIWMISLDAEK